jgi:flagellar hook-associated protein 1 FlgK
MSISNALNIGAQSLATYQQALAVTSHNISNADNTDYSRQRVILTAQTTTSSTGTIGAGVTMEDVTRVKNNIVDSQLRQYYGQNSMSTKTSDYLSQVESSLDEPGDSGLSSMITNFFNSWSQLAVTPDSSALRQNVVQSAQLMTQKLQSIYQGIQQITPDLESEASGTVKTINSTLQNIQSLNKQIYEAQLTGNDANDLMDSRDKAVNDLSKLANVNVTIDKDNSAVVSIGGVLAADRFSAMQFHTTVDNGQLKVQTSDNSTTVNLQSGELGAITQLHNNTLPDLTKQLNDVATKIMSQVNTLHASGYTAQTTPTTGVNFFSDYQNGVLTINPDILNNTNNIAASADGTTGNNTIAQSIADLSSLKLSDGTTITDSYASFVNTVGTKVQAANQTTDSTDSVVQQLEGQKSNYSGVSVDEEMTNIMKYQRSYEASAKVVTMANEVLQTLLAMVT